MNVYLGIDGGGTKTAFCLLDDSGSVLSRASTRTLYYFSEGMSAVAEVLADGIDEVVTAAGIGRGDITRAFVGLPGYGEVRADTAALDAAPRAVLGHDRYSCGNDMVCGWAGSLGGADGINVVAGTGSICYGERAGRGVRAGGWGEVFGDEGSAYWTGVAALRAASRMSDGRDPDGPLRPALLEHLGVDHDLDLLDVVLVRWRSDRGRIAGLARVVDAVAAGGDPVAVDILDRAGRELALLVHTTARRLGFGPGEPVAVSWSGGMFASTTMLDRFRLHLDQSDLGPDGSSRYHPVAPRFSPVLGACLYAAKEAGHPLDDAALDRMAHTTD